MVRLAALVLVAALAVASWIAWSNVGAPGEMAPAEQATAPSPSDTAPDGAGSDAAPRTAQPGEPTPSATAATPTDPPPADVAEQPAAERRAPRFDVVRVERDDSAMVAGVAEPDSTVSITVDGETVAELTTDSAGEFVGFLDLPRSDEVRRLDVVAADGTAADSEGPIFVAPSARSDPDEEPEAPAVVAMRESGPELIQRERRQEGDPVAVDIVSYQEGGTLAASGRGNVLRLVRLYANAQLIAETMVAADGTWSVETAATLPPGANTLRVDEIGQDGSVVSRVEAPFDAPQPDAPFMEPGEIMVERGETLWELAEQAYGDGLRFTVIYSANADRIRDPDLIFPGQILTIPSTAIRP
jgi:nucleoid-associated protein YgaU